MNTPEDIREDLARAMEMVATSTLSWKVRDLFFGVLADFYATDYFTPAQRRQLDAQYEMHSVQGPLASLANKPELPHPQLYVEEEELVRDGQRDAA